MRRSILLTALLLLLSRGPLSAQPATPRAESFQRAEELFSKDDLQQAEKLYLRNLESAVD